VLHIHLYTEQGLQ